MTMRKFLCLLVLSGAVISFVPQGQQAVAARQEIAAVVNEDVISMTDVSKRLRLIIASSGFPDNEDVRAKLAPQIISGLIDEQLMLQEARNMKITIEPKEIEDGFAAIGKQNNMTAEQFKTMLGRGKIDSSTLSRQIEAQLAWGKVVQKRLRPKVVISERDVDDVLARMRAKVGTTEYLAAEIFLPVNKADEDAEVKNFANRLLREMKSNKASFFKLAQQFSKSPGAAKGGDVGWLNEAQVSSEILEGLKKVSKNQVTEPIKSLNGYHIFFLRETRTLAEDKIPSRDQVFYNIGTERLDRLQRRHLMDLKSSSFIDVRV